MKKTLTLTLAFVLLLTGVSFAATRDYNSLTTAQKDRLNSVGSPTTISSDQQVLLGNALDDLISSYTRNGASTVLFSSSTAFQNANIPYVYVMKAIGNSPTAEATLLPQASWGRELTIFIYGCGGGSPSWTLTPDAAAASPVGGVKAVFNKITFNAIGQFVTLRYVNDTIGWVVLSTGTSASAADPTITYPTTQ